MQADASGAAAAPFVDFQDVWLAYNEELLRENHFAGDRKSVV